MIETKIVRERVCPAEVTAPLPAAIATPAEATISAAAEVLRWIGAHFAREAMLERRIGDAATQCQAVVP